MNLYMKLYVLLVLGIALSSCATEPTWQRMLPPSHLEFAANGCPMYTIDDAAPLSQWKTVAVFWDEDVCRGTPFQVAQIEERMEQSRESVIKKAEAGDHDSIEAAKCWDQKGYMTWTASASDALIAHKWNSIPYACVEKSDPRLRIAKSPAASGQYAGN